MKNKVSKPAMGLFIIGAIIAIVSATISFKSCKGCDEDYITVSGTVYARCIGEIPSHMYPFIEECTRHEIIGEVEKREDYIFEEEP